MEKHRTYLAIDLKSFYASVECTDRHLDPLTTNLVVADISRTEKTICLAVPPSLKAHGKELTANGGLDGANGVRQIGRFMLFHNINNVCARFTAVLQRILTAAKGNSLKIFVLTGIGGGTGSGTFLDVAYILRKIGGDLTPNVQLHGFIFTPDLNKRNGGDETSLYRNGFASLKELDYWMSASEHEQLFEQCYNNNFVVKSHDRPFDYCHIITAKDASHNIVSYSDAMDAVGSDLFSYIVSEQVSADGNM